MRDTNAMHGHTYLPFSPAAPEYCSRPSSTSADSIQPAIRTSCSAPSNECLIAANVSCPSTNQHARCDCLTGTKAPMSNRLTAPVGSGGTSSDEDAPKLTDVVAACSRCLIAALMSFSQIEHAALVLKRNTSVSFGVTTARVGLLHRHPPKEQPNTQLPEHWPLFCCTMTLVSGNSSNTAPSGLAKSATFLCLK